MSDESTFVRGILDNPMDDSLLFVYADWLEERGDVRGELLRLVPALADRSSRACFLALCEQVDPAWLVLLRRRWVRARLTVVRGLRVGVSYPVYEGENHIGSTGWRPSPHPLDIDLGAEPPDGWGVHCVPEQAIIRCQGSALDIEDLNSPHGTFVSRTRAMPGHRRALQADDRIQMGTFQLLVSIGN
jgi:uncharacterized protein (TIGR02996 family)